MERMPFLGGAMAICEETEGEGLHPVIFSASKTKK
jgi:hypothetical protein